MNKSRGAQPRNVVDKVQSNKCTRNSSCRCTECTAAIQMSNMSEALRPAPIDDIPLEEYATFSRNSSNGKFGLTLLKSKIKKQNPQQISSENHNNQNQSHNVQSNRQQMRQIPPNVQQVTQSYQQPRYPQNQVLNQQPTRNIQSQSEVRSQYPKSSRDNISNQIANQNIPRQVESQPAFGNSRSNSQYKNVESSYPNQSQPQYSQPNQYRQGGVTCTRQSGCKCSDCQLALGTLSGRNVIQPQDNQMDLHDCHVCGRRFNSDIIDKHVQICEKNAHKKKRVFDMKKQRIQGAIELNGPDAASVLKQASRQKSDSNPQNSRAPPNKQSKWKLQSEQLRRAMRQAQTSTDGNSRDNDGGNQYNDPEPNDDYVQCPHCNRRFDPTVAERHIPKCMDIRAKPTRLVRGQGITRQLQLNKPQINQTTHKPAIIKKR